MPEPASLYPEDTNPFLAKRLTAEAEGEGETPTTGASEANWEEPNEPEVEGTDEVESADTDQIEKEDPQPQVVLALGLLITKRDPSSPS